MTALIAAVVLGLCLAAVEKYHQEKAWRFWGKSSEVLAYYLDPLRNRTQKTVLVARKARQLWKIEDDNQELRQKLTRVELNYQLALEQLGRLERLSGLGRWTGPQELKFLPADVTGLLTNEQGAVLVINRGRKEGVRQRDPVVSLGGLVGIVREVSAHGAYVQALSDHMSGVGAVVRSTRARGVVVGRGRGEPLEFKPENEVLPIQEGDELVTDGFENSVYPKGIKIGTVQKRSVSADGLIYGQVQPAVPFETIEEVLIVLPRDRTGLKTGDDDATSTLGQFSIEMPSVADHQTTATRHQDGATSDTQTSDTQTSDTRMLDEMSLLKDAAPSTTTLPAAVPPAEVTPVATPAPEAGEKKKPKTDKPAGAEADRRGRERRSRE